MNTKTAKTNSYFQKTTVLIGVTIIFVSGYSLYQNVTLGLNAVKNYEQYQECDKFLMRDGAAGTTGLAKEELEKAVSWLKDNYSNESFEYRDLKSSLNYLKTQPTDSLIPTVLKESINQNKNAIRDIEREKLENGWNWSNLIFSMSLLIVFSSIVLAIIENTINS